MFTTLFKFFQSPTANTLAWILTQNMSNYAALHKEVPFGVRTVKFNNLPDFCKNLKTFYFRNCDIFTARC